MFLFHVKIFFHKNILKGNHSNKQSTLQRNKTNPLESVKSVAALFRNKMLPTLKRNLVIDQSIFERNKTHHL